MPVGRYCTCADRHGDVFCQLLFPDGADAQGVAASVFHFCLQPCLLVVVENGLACLDIHSAGIAEVRCRLEYCAFLSVIHADFLNVIHRELPEIHLSVLCVAEFHAVIIHSEVL